MCVGAVLLGGGGGRVYTCLCAKEKNIILYYGIHIPFSNVCRIGKL